MLCPNCGTRTTNEHKFCRNCGMNLEPVTRALAAHLSHGGAAAPAARAAAPNPVGRMTSGLFAGLFVVAFGVLLMALVPGRAFKFLGVASALLGIVAALAAVFSTLRRAEEAGAEPTPNALDGAAPNTGRLLREQTFDRAPASVTDHTTELLHAQIKEGRTRPGD